MDNVLFPRVTKGLRQAGHDAVQVRDYGLQAADDVKIFEQAAKEEGIIVSADMDLGRLWARRTSINPSVILFLRTSGRWLET